MSDQIELTVDGVGTFMVPGAFKTWDEAGRQDFIRQIVSREESMLEEMEIPKTMTDVGVDAAKLTAKSAPGMLLFPAMMKGAAKGVGLTSPIPIPGARVVGGILGAGLGGLASTSLFDGLYDFFASDYESRPHFGR
jgi:hypothetical protein